MQRQRTEPFNIHSISPSRLNNFFECGVAFKKEYIELLPFERSGSAALFGTVLHAALEKWSLDREHSLVNLVAGCWQEELEGTPLKHFLEEYRPLSIKARKLEKDICQRRPDIKAPRMTRDWKQSQVSKDIFRLQQKWSQQLEGSFYTFTESDPLPKLFDESLILARKYELRARQWPSSLQTELPFNVPLEVDGEEYRFTGYIDSLEFWTEVPEGLPWEPGYVLRDYKSYAREPYPNKDRRQMLTYRMAFEKLVELGFLDLPLSDSRGNKFRITCVLDYPRLGDFSTYSFGDAEWTDLVTDVALYSKAVKAGVFLPAGKSRNPDYCPFPSSCCMTRGESCSG